MTFIGEAEVYDENIYLNTETGVGYDKLIEKMDEYISRTALKCNLDGFDTSDLKQNIILYVLEVARKYNPNKGMKLSTFIQMSVKRRLINKMRNQNGYNRNPTILKTSLYSVRCKCNNKFIVNINDGECVEEKICPKCNNPLIGAKYHPSNKPPRTLNALECSSDIIIDDIMSDVHPDFTLVFGDHKTFYEDVEFKYDLQKIFSRYGKSFKNTLNKICFEDKSVDASIQETGISTLKFMNKIETIKRDKDLIDLLRFK